MSYIMEEMGFLYRAVLAATFVFSQFSVWAQDSRPSLDFCAREFEAIAWDAPQIVNLADLKKQLAQKGPGAVKDFFLKLNARGELLKKTAQGLALRNGTAGEKYYAAIGKQVPKEGFVRALSVREIYTIFSEGGMGSGYDFNFREAGARVGHGGNFIFVMCRKCADESFTKGNLGSGVLNAESLSLDQLEIVIPSVLSAP